MVKPFQFARIPRIFFKKGSIADLPAIARPFGSKIALVTGKSSFNNSGYAERLFHDFTQSGIGYHIIVVSGEPSPEIIDTSVRKLSGEGIELVIGIGGGSVIDAGKAVSAMINKPESVVEFLEGVGNKDHPGTKVPFVAVPTTSGTGSEATKNAVISKIGKSGFKKSLRHDNLVPDIAIIDPELTIKCPREITAASGMDCFTQLTEAFLSDKASEYSDALAMEGLKAVKSSLVRSYTNGEDTEARTGMSFAALTSGICLANAGLGVVHGFASSIGGMFDIPHGQLCSLLMASANEINVRELRKTDSNPSALKKYSLLGQLFLDDKGKTDDFYIDGFIVYLYNLTDKFQLPVLRKYGIKENDIDLICRNTECKNNPVKLGKDNLIKILSSRLF
jgi:alcohol dehydrogenase class IV